MKHNNHAKLTVFPLPSLAICLNVGKSKILIFANQKKNKIQRLRSKRWRKCITNIEDMTLFLKHFLQEGVCCLRNLLLAPGGVRSAHHVFSPCSPFSFFSSVNVNNNFYLLAKMATTARLKWEDFVSPPCSFMLYIYYSNDFLYFYSKLKYE